MAKHFYHLVACVVLGTMGSVFAEQPTDEVELSPMIERLLDDPYTSDAEKQSLRLEHGQWDDLTDLTLDQAATLALMRYDLEAIASDDEAVSPMTRARAAYERGEPTVMLDLLQEDASALATLWRARAMLDLGRVSDAVMLLEPWRERLEVDTMDDAQALTAATQCVVLLARLQGRPTQDYQLAIRLFARARTDLDPLDPRIRLAEASLLIDKANRPQAVDAWQEALTLNPKSGEAWHGLGRSHAEAFNFAKAQEAIDQLRQINPDHPLATLLETFSLLRQRDVQGARRVIEPLLARYPNHRRAIALLAAVESLSYNDTAMQAVFDRYNVLAPNSAEPYYVVGELLALARQYESAQMMLRQAIRREPNWAQPHIQLGLLLMQVGDLSAAHTALVNAERLDRFNVRATNQLKLVEAMLSYERIETEHFIITYVAGPDAALARDMPQPLERIYSEITAAFSHRPQRKTQINIMPDESHFAVRITGMPDIWTIAASTGDVIALTPPRPGSDQAGSYDWVNVVRHEFVHTVTLSQTHNRIPHWFTEACAVSQELIPRDYETCKLLAWALHEDKLFAYRDINWGFIRPQHRYSRPLAYAQANWMFQYIVKRFGHHAIVQLLELYRDGMDDVTALKQVTRLDPETFMNDFLIFAHQQVTRWGLAPPKVAISEISQGATFDELFSLHQQHPQDLDLLQRTAAAAVREKRADHARSLVLKYASKRPVDPWPYRMLVTLALETGNTAEAIAGMEQLDRLDAHQGTWADQLSKVYRGTENLPGAMKAITRAIRREPYNANYRQTAATIALQRRDLVGALHHLRAVADLEPDRAVHFVRLAAIYHKLDNAEAARAAALQARALDASVEVDRFLK